MSATLVGEALISVRGERITIRYLQEKELLLDPIPPFSGQILVGQSLDVDAAHHRARLEADLFAVFGCRTSRSAEPASALRLIQWPMGAISEAKALGSVESASVAVQISQSSLV